jgi:hypothetical protein
LNDDWGFGCPVWNMHQVLDYDRKNKPDIANVLDSFIPMDNGNPNQCVMFNQADGEIEGQNHFEF